MKRRICSILIGSACALAATSCVSAQDTTADANRRHEIVFIDLTASTNSADRERWLCEIQRELADSLKQGDRLSLFGIHDNTKAAGALFDGELQSNNRRPGFDGDLESNRSARLARTEFANALHSTVELKRCATRSDVLGFVEVVRRQMPSNRRLVVLLASDMLESTSLLDLEKELLSPDSVASEIQRIATNYGWGPNTLEGVEIRVVTPSVGIGQRVIQDPGQLERFYRELFTAMGARVTRFSPASQMLAGGQ